MGGDGVNPGHFEDGEDDGVFSWEIEHVADPVDYGHYYQVRAVRPNGDILVQWIVMDGFWPHRLEPSPPGYEVMGDYEWQQQDPVTAEWRTLARIWQPARPRAAEVTP